MAGEDTRSYISHLTLPNNNTYYFKDEVARSLITSNGSFRIAWNGTGTPDASKIPDGIIVGNTEGTLAASADTLKDFYLVKSTTEIGNDIYDEYVTVDNGESANPRYTWEKIGDTQIQLSEVVTNVTLNKLTTNFVTSYTNLATASVVKSDANFTVTNPTITVTPTTTYILAAASGGSVTYNSKVTTAAITGYTPESGTVVTGITTTKNQKLVQTTITGVSGSVTASKANATTSQTTVSNFTSNTSTTAFFKGWSVSDENLTISGVLPTTLTTTLFTFDNVIVPKAATSSTTVATGAIGPSASGATIVTDVTSSTTSALTSLGESTTASVLGADTTLKLGSNLTISLSTTSNSGTGKVSVATGISSASATGGSVALANNSTTTVLTSIGTATTAAALNDNTSITVTKAV